MANCKNCGAALPPASIICTYCHTRNDVDLHAIHRYTTEVPETARSCPRCALPLETIDLKIEGRFLIERCRRCFGLFFDPGEMEALLDRAVSNVYAIDFARLKEINGYRPVEEYGQAYIKCPVCQRYMNRFNVGTRSGVIADRCKDHGVWLDGGELRQLLEWTKAGGRVHTMQTELEAERIALAEKMKRLKEIEVGPFLNPAGRGEPEDLTIDLDDLLGRAFRAIVHGVQKLKG
jgi:Zn-finger nucleic acid-binding protein